MRNRGELHPTLRLLGEALNTTLKLEADLKNVAEALRRLEKSEGSFKETTPHHTRQMQHVNR